MNQPTAINEFCKAAYQNAVEKGFYENEPSIPERLCLIHSEVSEALECDRKGKFTDTNLDLLYGWVNDGVFQQEFINNAKDTFEDELADIVIRVFDLAASRGIDLEKHILLKMRYNSLRPYKHGKKY